MVKREPNRAGGREQAGEGEGEGERNKKKMRVVEIKNL